MTRALAGLDHPVVHPDAVIPVADLAVHLGEDILAGNDAVGGGQQHSLCLLKCQIVHTVSFLSEKQGFSV